MERALDARSDADPADPNTPAPYICFQHNTTQHNTSSATASTTARRFFFGLETQSAQGYGPPIMCKKSFCRYI
jgi:hypothetical protein